MKKNVECGYSVRQWPKKMLRVMKVGFFLLVLGLTSVHAATFSQQRVTLEVKDQSLLYVLDQLQEQSGYTFLFSSSDVKGVQGISLKAKEEDVFEVLKRCLKGTGIVFEVNDRLVVLRRGVVASDSLVKKSVKILGLVTDEKKQPLPGVTILVKGSTTGTATDKNGKYRFTISPMDHLTLVFSFIGMVPVEVKYVGKDTINVVMKEELAALDEVQVIATGYQNIDRRYMTGAYTTKKGDDVLMPAYNSLDQMLQGQVAGMIVTNTSSRVGTTPKIQIRGTSTLLGSTSPLWVVDGIIQPEPLSLSGNAQFTQDLSDIIGNQIAWLNPQDIETITVLKDASATAVYGSRASNGVIVVTTKRGNVDRLTVGYAGNFSYKSRPNYDQFNLMNSQERIEFSEDAFNLGSAYLKVPYKDWNTYEGMQRMFLEGEIDEEQFVARRQELESVNTDWFKLLTRRAFSHNHRVSVSGGTEKITYNASFGYSKEEGQEIGNGKENFTGRVALNVSLRKNIRLNVTVNGNNSTTHTFVADVNPIGYATSTSRSIPAFDEHGDPAYYQLTNDYLYNDLNETLGYNFMNERDNSGTKLRSSLFSTALDFRWDMTSWLAYQFVGAYSQTNKSGETYRSEKTFWIANKYRGYDYNTAVPGSPYFKAARLPFGGQLYTVDANQYSYNIQNKLLISKSFNPDNRLNVMLGMEVRAEDTRGVYNTVWGYVPGKGNSLVRPADKIEPLGTTSVPPVFSVFEEYYGTTKAWKKDNYSNNYFSWFATLAYSFKERYVLNFSIRNDASNRFGQNTNKRLDPTYSFGASWKLAEESFMRSLQDGINMCTLRATYGIQGNVLTNKSPEITLRQEGVAELYSQYYSTISSIPNPYLSWERTKTWNLGMDLELFHIFNVTGEYYVRNSNAIVQQDISYEYGKGSMDANGGEIRNSGLEFTVTFIPIRKKDVALSISLNSSKNWNKAKGKTLIDPAYNFYTDGYSNRIVRKGYPVGSIWSYSFAGLDGKDGRPLFNNIDIPADQRDPKIDPLTFLVYTGTTSPDFTGGLNLNFRYKSFSLGTSFALLLGGYKRLPSPYKNILYGKNIPVAQTNLSRDLIKRWKKSGDEFTTNIPGMLRGEEYQYTLPSGQKKDWIEMWDKSDAMVVDATFLRCRELSLRYTMNREVCERLGFKTLSVSAVVNNLFVIASDRFNGFDPELGNSVTPKSYSLGINVGF